MIEVVYVLMFVVFRTTMIEVYQYDDLKTCKEVAANLQTIAEKEFLIGTYHCAVFPK